MDILLKHKKWVAVVGLIIILLLNAFLLNFIAFRCFNIFDMGSFLDASWRVYKGQKPYIDFLYHTGPLHLYMNAFFFSVFGFGKTAILMHMVTVSSILIVMLFLTIYSVLPVGISLLTAFLFSASFYIPPGHPWYDHSAHFWGILGFLVIMKQIIKKQSSPNNSFIYFFTGIMVVLSFMTKTNIGAAYGLVFFIFWIFYTKNIKALLIYAMGAGITFLIMLVVIKDPRAYFYQTILTYGAEQSSRLHKLSSLASWLPKSYVSIMLIVLVNIWKQRRQLKLWIILFFAFNFIAIFAMRTSQLGSANTPLRGIILAIAFILLYQNIKFSQDLWSRRIHQISMAALIVLSLAFAKNSIQYGIERGIWIRGSFEMGDYQLKSKPLAGWWFKKNDGEQIDQMVEYINANIPKNETLLVLTDLQVLYALTGRDSYRGIPFIFSDVGTEGQLLEQVQNHIYQNPPDWILGASNRIFLRKRVYPEQQPLMLSDDFILSYQRIKVWEEYGLFKRIH